MTYTHLTLIAFINDTAMNHMQLCLGLRRTQFPLTHFIPTTTVVVVTLSIPTTTVVVVAHCIPTTTFVVVDNDLSNMSAVNRPRARNPRDTCAVNRMYYHCLCTAAIEQVLCSLRAVLTKLVTIVAESLSSILPKWRPRMIRSVM